MDATLVVNPGSSSKKYAIFKGGREVFSSLFEHTEAGFGKCVEMNGTRQLCEDVGEKQYGDALHDALDLALEAKVIGNITDITRVGVRIVAPGTFFTTHRVVDGAYVRRLSALQSAAPLHIPHELSELALLREAFPLARIIGVSDSAFHATMPPHARQYGLRKRDAIENDLYRFGYHGLSVASVVRQVSKESGRVPHRMVVCHVGGGVSVTAVQDGKSVNTTMGFAPASGLMMGSRAGDIDPAALVYLLKCHGGNIEAVERVVSEESGLKGFMGSSDLRVALDRASRNDPEAQVVVSMYIEGIRKAIGAMAAVLGGIDVLALTGTAPERNSYVRARITERFEYLGLLLDEKANEALDGRAGVVSAPKSTVEVRTVHTDELGEIAHIASIF